jgi:hypothetical protein
VTPSAIERYVLVSLLVEFVAAISVIKFAGWPLWLQWTAQVLAALKILEIIRVTASVVLFDEGVVASVQRTFILAALNFIELGLCYGFFYALNDQLLAPSPAGARLNASSAADRQAAGRWRRAQQSGLPVARPTTAAGSDGRAFNPSMVLAPAVPVLFTDQKSFATFAATQPKRTR